MVGVKFDTRKGLVVGQVDVFPSVFRGLIGPNDHGGGAHLLTTHQWSGVVTAYKVQCKPYPQTVVRQRLLPASSVGCGALLSV